MEKILSPEEKIRRAEDIYYRRKFQSLNKQTARVNVEKKNNNLLKKFVIQFMVCLSIYLLWQGLKSSNYPLFSDISNKIQYVLGYDIDFGKIYSDIKEKDNEQKDIENIEVETAIETMAHVQEENEKLEAVDSISTIEEMPEEASSISQMNEDAEYIKSNISIIKPLTGTITSRFGLRESDNPKVAGFHTGIDIAVNEGTVFTSAMDGKVVLVSSVGDYRKPF